MKKHFDPEWSDLTMEKEVLDIPLFLPEDTERTPEKDVWIKSQWEYREKFNGKPIELKQPRKIVAVLRRPTKNYQWVVSGMDGEDKRVVQEDEPLYDFLYPPKAWMCDSLQERSTMYQAAKEAKGNVLVGGLGLGIYPQFVLSLGRPVNAITIIENSDEIIDLIGNPLLQYLKEQHPDIKISLIRSDLEKFIHSTKEKFDTIYLDTWGDLHISFLPYINHLIAMAEEVVSPNGQIYCWGYNFMYEDFLQMATLVEENLSRTDELRTEGIIPLIKYIEWRKQLTYTPTKEEYIQKAKEMATTIKSSEAKTLTFDLPRGMERYFGVV